MPPSCNTQKLKDLMRTHKLKAPQVAALLGRSAHTVREWRCCNANNIPDQLLELLQLKLGSREEKA